MSSSRGSIPRPSGSSWPRRCVEGSDAVRAAGSKQPHHAGWHWHVYGQLDEYDVLVGMEPDDRGADYSTGLVHVDGDRGVLASGRAYPRDLPSSHVRGAGA